MCVREHTEVSNTLQHLYRYLRLIYAFDKFNRKRLKCSDCYMLRKGLFTFKSTLPQTNRFFSATFLVEMSKMFAGRVQLIALIQFSA